MTKKQVRENKIEKAISEIKQVFNKHQLNIPEIILTYGNLGYHLGASIAGCETIGPSLEELQRTYYSSPTVDIGLMLQGLLITSWEQDFLKTPKISSIGNKYKRKKEEE
jgi:hypothetical protein